MKILVLCYEYPPIGGGGGRMAHNVSAALVRRGHEVCVQTVWMPGLKKLELRDGVKIHRAFAFRRKADRCSVPEMGAYLITAFLPSLVLVRSWRPDVVHAHFAVPSGVLALACKLLTGVPYVITAHLGDLPGGNPEQTANWFRILNPFIRPVWKMASAASASSSFAVQLAEKAYGIRPVMIPNGIDMSGRPSSASPTETPLRLVAIGRFQPQKNFPWMIEALGGCKTPWILNLIGDGEQAEQIRECIRKNSLERRVTLCGWVPEEKMRRVLRDSDLLVMPSTSEGNPVAAIEALKYGLPILGSNIPGLSDLIENGKNGFSVSLDSFEEFQQRLDVLTISPEVVAEMKQESLHRSAQFDIEQITNAFESLLQKATNNCTA